MEHTIGLPEGTKFDFQNIDVKLYLALRAMTQDYKQTADSGDAGNYRAEDQDVYNKAMLALAEFELSHGPLPDWAIGRNWDYSLVPGAQLCTKDGRKHGNAHVLRVQVRKGISYTEPVYDCITDAGSYIHDLTEQEILGMFWVGDWISDPKTLVSRFGIKDQEYAGGHF